MVARNAAGSVVPAPCAVGGSDDIGAGRAGNHVEAERDEAAEEPTFEGIQVSIAMRLLRLTKVNPGPDLFIPQMGTRRSA
jgi:hypothetical protein